MSENEMPFIGDDNFSGPTENSVRNTASLPGKDTDPSIEAEVMAKLTPASAEEVAAKYEKNLEEAGVAKEKARSMMEDLLVRGYYEESLKLGPQDIMFRTRTDEHSRQLFRMMEAESFNLSGAVSDFVSRFNLAGSLVRYGKRHFKHPDPMEDYKQESLQEFEKEFDTRFTFVTRLPQQVVTRLAHMLYGFDGRVAAVLNDGAPQNF